MSTVDLSKPYARGDDGWIHRVRHTAATEVERFTGEKSPRALAAAFRVALDNDLNGLAALLAIAQENRGR